MWVFKLISIAISRSPMIIVAIIITATSVIALNINPAINILFSYLLLYPVICMIIGGEEKLKYLEERNIVLESKMESTRSIMEEFFNKLRTLLDGKSLKVVDDAIREMEADHEEKNHVINEAHNIVNNEK